MKKIIFSLIITFSLLILSNVESKGQCDSCVSPSTQYTFQMTLANGCGPITVTFCALCNPNGHPEARLCTVTIPYTVSQCQNLTLDPSFWIEIKKEMLKYMYYNCVSLEIDPCPLKVLIDVYNATCKYVEIDNINQTANILSCETEAGLCQQEWQLCWNTETEELFIGTNGPAVQIEEGDCPFLNPTFNPANPYIITTDCFSTCY